MKALLLLCLAIISTLGSTGCSAVVASSATNNVSELLRPGTSRQEIVRRLGAPLNTRRFSLVQAGSQLEDAPRDVRQATVRVATLDEYRPNGLLITPTDKRYTTEFWAEGYSTALILTGGLIEVAHLPYTLGDLAARGTQRFRLRLWYDPADRLIDYDRQPAPAPPKT